MSKVLLLTLLIFSPLALAYNFICANPSGEYKGVTCCIELSSCKKIIDEKVPQRVLNHVQLQSVNEKKFDRPNCFWAALNFIFDDASYPPKYILNKDGENSFEKILLRNFTSISQSDLREYDLITFEVDQFKRLVQSENERSKVWFKSPREDGFRHAAVYLGENILFQKESNRTNTYIISTFDQAYKAYARSKTMTISFKGSASFHRPISP